MTTAEREALLDDFCAAAIWQLIYFRWRPNLPDANDDHVLELAIASGVEQLVTHNTRDFSRGELKFASPRVVTPAQHLKIVKLKPYLIVVMIHGTKLCWARHAPPARACNGCLTTLSRTLLPSGRRKPALWRARSAAIRRRSEAAG